jgi:hypothetical protein
VANQDDFYGWHKILGNLLIKRSLFRYAFTAIVSFLSMDEMVVEIRRIVRSNGNPSPRMAIVEVLIDMSGVVIDDDDHTTGLCRMACVAACRAGLFQKFPQPRDFVDTKFIVMRALEKGSLRANNEGQLITPLRLCVAKMPDQLNRLIPAQIARQLAVKKTPMQQLQIMTNMFTHPVRIS